MDVRLKHPFTCVIAGPTGCGKTQWVKKLLTQSETVVNKPPQNIIWCYGEYQPAYIEIQQTVGNVTFIEGIPDDLSQHINKELRNLIIIDDLMTECEKDKRVTHLFTKGSHHKNLSVILILQNLFQQGRECRTISLNTHYFALFKNPRDGSQITHLAKQMYPGNIKFVQESYRDATRSPYGYLFVDLKPETPEEIRLRTHIFPGETQYAYVPRKV